MTTEKEPTYRMPDLTRLDWVAELAVRFVTMVSVGSRTGQNAVVDVAVGFNPVEMAHFCSRVVFHFRDPVNAYKCLTDFTNRLSWTPIPVPAR